MNLLVENLNRHLSSAFGCEVVALELMHPDIKNDLIHSNKLSLQEFERHVLKETVFSTSDTIKYLPLIFCGRRVFIKLVKFNDADDISLYSKVRLLTNLIEENVKFKNNSIVEKTESLTFFLNKILNYQNEEEMNSIKLWNIDLGYNLELPRITCVISFKNLPIKDNKEHIKNMILNKVRSHTFITKEDIVSFINSEQLVICKAVDRQDEKNFYNNFIDFFNFIDMYTLQNYRIRLRCGVGLCHRGFENIKNSFEEAIFALEFKIQSSPAFLEDYLLQYVLSKIPFSTLEHFFKEKYSLIKSRPELIQTIAALVDNDMNVGQAAASIFVHKNTLIFRIRHIKKILNLDPFRKENDRVTLLLLDHYIKTIAE